MKLKSFVITAAVCASLLLTTAQAATTLRVIGRSPFYQPPLTSVDDLKQMIRIEETDVKRGFDLTPQADLFPVFMDQVFKAEIETVAFEKGSKFEWMLYKKKGKGAVRVVKDVTWGSEKPFTGYKFYIDTDGNRYTFAVPLGCGNIAFMGMRAIPAVAVVPPVELTPTPTLKTTPTPIPPANQPPRCGLVVTPIKAFCGDMITIDATSSTDADGKVEKMSVVFVDSQGQVISEKVVDGPVLQTEVAMPCGNNTLKVTVTDNDGEDGASPECTVNVTGVSRVGFLADVGYFHQFDPGHYLFGRIGLEYKFTEDWSLLGLVGGAAQVDGLDGESAFLIDVLAEYKWSRYYVDFGAGGWITDGDDDNPAENSQLDLIVGLGARVYGEPDAFNTSLFVEVRSATDELDEIGDYGRFGFGVRFRF
ncbi:MAG: hypothetical protein KAI39_04935 [Desulfobulbaceae bacterium]|nr:hypothetical protein [Desulfobulbaceae bacterium]